MNRQFYSHSEDIHNLSSAEVILPILFNYYEPKSIIDIGTGIGTWLAVAKKNKVKDVLGVDGDYVDPSLLRKYLTHEEFLSHDLRSPLNLNRKYDLAICLEVAEHLPAQSADILVQTLSKLSDYLLFSAAVPYQGGQNHLNEQPPEYWISKFEKKGYYVYDIIRPRIWDNAKVNSWYKQNILFFSKASLDLPKPIFNYLIHPEIFLIHAKQELKKSKELDDIKGGRASSGFYFKRFFQSFIR